MAGRNVAPDLTGMFNAINQGIVSDQTGAKYNETLRRSLAPRVDHNDSASLLQYANWARRNNYSDEANQYMALGATAQERERQTEERLAVQRGRAEIADLQAEMTQLFLDPAISETDRTQKLASLQLKVNEVARSVPGMDPNAYAKMSQNVDQFYTERARAEAQDRRDEAVLDIQTDRLGLDKEANARAGQRHKQLMESGALEIENARVTAEINKMTLASKLASAYVGQEGGKEQFLSRQGMESYGGLFDQVELEYETQQAQLETARAALQENKPFDYSQKDLEEMLYLMPDPVESAKQLRKIAEGSPPSVAHQQLIGMLNGQSATNKLPEATLLKLFNNMAQGRVEAEKSGTAAGQYVFQDTTMFGGKLGYDDGDEAKALAQISAAMLNAYMAAPNPAQGLQDVQLILTYGLMSTGAENDAGGNAGDPAVTDELTLEEIAAQLGVTP